MDDNRSSADTSGRAAVSELNDILRMANPHGGATIGDLLHAVRSLLETDLDFLAEFVKGDRVYRFVDAGADACVIQAGGEHADEDSTCYGIAVSPTPILVADAHNDPRLRDLDVTRELNIGSYIGVPLRLSDGTLQGTVCAIRHGDGPAFTERDALIVELLARYVADQFDSDKLPSHSPEQRRERVERILAEKLVHMVYQPIIELETGEPVGLEALARFDIHPSLPPNVWFAEAAALGLGVELEALAIETALRDLEVVPANIYLAVNASAAALRNPRINSLFDQVPPGRLVVELTEHDNVEEYQALAESLQALRARGIQLAIDDAGTGYAGLKRILSLEPNLLKLDLSLTRGIDTDPVRQALASGLISFAGVIGAKLIAEGIETQGEYDEMRRLGLHFAQGYFLGRPAPLSELLV